jgi:hypothetical protein
MANFTNLIKKYGFGTILAVATLDGYRRTINNDILNKAKEEINKEKAILTELQTEMLETDIDLKIKETNLDIKVSTSKDAVSEYEQSIKKIDNNHNEYNKLMTDADKTKLDKAIDDLVKSDLFEIFKNIYDKYLEFLSNLSADKIVAMFNIIMNGLILSSFFTVLSILLSEQLINRFTFLEKYPRILKLLRLRIFINKKINKFYLIIHLILIIFAVLGNIYILII